MPKALRMVVALSVTVLLLVALAGLAAQAGAFAPATFAAVADGSTPVQVGDPAAMDPKTGLPPEDPPYTQAEPIFNPQLVQAPVKDSVTWNPIFMSEFETLDGNEDLYGRIKASGLDATEKVWFRQWYEPWHWDKDWNANGTLDIEPEAQIPYTLTKGTKYDEWYPAIMQEFTYMLLEAKQIEQKPEPTTGRVGETTFVFPIGQEWGQLADPAGFGLTSLDADDDGTEDIVHVDSEVTLFAATHIAADFDGDGQIDTLDSDAAELNGNELAIFRLDPKSLIQGGTIQFLDHYVEVVSILSESVTLRIYYTGDRLPALVGSVTLNYNAADGHGDMALAGRVGPVQRVRAVATGWEGTNMCDFPTGPWFVYLAGIDTADQVASLIIGRALGATWSAMEEQVNRPDQWPGDPYNLKRFYVDGHEYNVVAIKTDNGRATTVPKLCDLDADDDHELDIDPRSYGDPTLFKFITIRTTVPKTGDYEDTGGGYLIEQHSVRLQAYDVQEPLSVMPPYNMDHYVLLDVQALTDSSTTVPGSCPSACITETLHGFTCREDYVPYFGQLIGPVDPVGADYYYVSEDTNWQFLGELKEKYGEHGGKEFWYVEQFQTLPWEYTEFVFPDITPADPADDPDLYLLTSAWIAPQSQALLWTQDELTPFRYKMRWDAKEDCWVRDDTVNAMPAGWKPRVKFWFNPAETDRNWKYKSGVNMRLYGFKNEGAGVKVTDPKAASYPVEVWPYTDPWAPFNPQLPQAPVKDSLTLNPAYMDKYTYGTGDELVELYEKLSIREQDAREKVFRRMWYEPEYLDKYLVYDPKDPTPPFTNTTAYTFPAVLQEFTYMYVDVTNQPAHAQPGSSAFAFPVATHWDELFSPTGFGLTTFDANFDDEHDIVQVHSERSLAKITGVNADFNGDGLLSELDKDGAALTGDELVIFASDEIVLQEGDPEALKSVQFLDHMITLENVSISAGGAGRATLRIRYTGGGLDMVPDDVGTPMSLGVGQMGIADKTKRIALPSYGNLGHVDGAWFVYVSAVDTTDPANEKATVIVGRALGATHSAIDNGAGFHDEKPGDPWYLKRFFVDGHEYNVVALYTARADFANPGDEGFEFKYITIRTPVPKVEFVNREDSQRLQDYAPPSDWISVLPPFNYQHTEMDDVQALPEKTEVGTDPCCLEEQFTFANEDLQNLDCHGSVFTDGPAYFSIPPTHIRIMYEEVEPQFFVEMKEMYYDNGGKEIWQTEQWHLLPDQYTEFEFETVALPDDQRYLYLITSDWESEQSRLYYYGCEDITQADLHAWNAAIPAANTVITGTGQEFFTASAQQRVRVKFLYDPLDPEDIYVNIFQALSTLRTYGSGIHSVRGGVAPAPTPTATPTRTPTRTPTPTRTATPVPGTTGCIAGTVRLQGRTNHTGATVTAGGVSATTASNGSFNLCGVPAGTHTVRASMPGYLFSEKTGVVVTAGGTASVPTVQLLGGDACGIGGSAPDCKVDLFDLVFIATKYGSSPPADARADLNANGAVDIYDLVMVGVNLNKECAGPWSAPSPAELRVAEGASLRVEPVGAKYMLDNVFTATLTVADVTDLYGVDIQLQFAPGVLEVLDADPLKEGVQVVSGPFLMPADPNQVGANVADNENGTVHYALTLAPPATAADGSGVVCSIVFHTKGLGVSALHLDSAKLLNTQVVEIPVTPYDGSVRVQTLIYLPLIYRAYQQR